MPTLEQREAWKAFRRDRTLVRSNPRRCEKCKKRHHDIHAHHDDYAKPLEVRWLCRSCHFRLHGELKRAKRKAA